MTKITQKQNDRLVKVLKSLMEDEFRYEIDGVHIITRYGAWACTEVEHDRGVTSEWVEVNYVGDRMLQDDDIALVVHESFFSVIDSFRTSVVECWDDFNRDNNGYYAELREKHVMAISEAMVLE